MQKNRMLQFSESPEHVEFRDLHNLEIKTFPKLRNLLQFGWAATSFAVIAGLFASGNGVVSLPYWLTVSLAVIFLAAAHILLNTTYITAIRRKLNGKSAAAYFIFPAFVAALLFFADWRGSSQIVESFTHKANFRDIDKAHYDSRSNEVNARFDTEKQSIERNMKAEIANATAWERGEINRFNKLPQTSWTAKKISEFQSTISNETARVSRKYDKKLSGLFSARDTSLNRIYVERNAESTTLSRLNLSELEKENTGQRSANNAGWLISLFFLISYAIITYRIEFCKFKGGITKDNSTTPLDQYGGLFGYFKTVINEVFLKKAISSINRIATYFLGDDTEHVIKGITSYFNIVTPTQSLQNVTAPVGKSTTIGFGERDSNGNIKAVTTVITPVTPKNTVTVTNNDIHVTEIVKQYKMRISQVQDIGKGRTAKTVRQHLSDAILKMDVILNEGVLTDKYKKEAVDFKNKCAAAIAELDKKEVQNV